MENKLLKYANDEAAKMNQAAILFEEVRAAAAKVCVKAAFYFS